MTYFELFKEDHNYLDALALYFVYYNFCLIHKSLRVTSAMAPVSQTSSWT